MWNHSHARRRQARIRKGRRVSRQQRGARIRALSGYGTRVAQLRGRSGDTAAAGGSGQSRPGC